MNERAFYESLLILRNSEQLAPFKEWMQDQLEVTRNRLEALTDADALRVEQGRARTYSYILGLIESAPKTLNKIVT